MRYIAVLIMISGFLSSSLLALHTSESKKRRLTNPVESSRKRTVEPITIFLNVMENYNNGVAPENVVKQVAAFTMLDYLESPERIELIIKTLEDKKIKIENSHRETLIKSYVLKLNHRKVISLLESYKEKAVYLSYEIYEQIIELLIDSKKASQAQEILLDLLERGDKPQSRIFEKFFKYFVEQRDVYNIKWTISLIKKHKIDNVFFTIAVFSKSSCKNESNLILKILSLSSEFFSEGAISALCDDIAQYHPNKGSKILDLLRNINVKPRIETYSFLIANCIKNKKFEKAQTLLREMHKHKYKLKTEPHAFVVYDSLIKAFFDDKNYEKAADLFDEMCYYCLRPNSDIYDKIIDVLIEQKNLVRATEIFRAMTLSRRELPVVSFYQKFFRILMRANYLDAALGFYSEMKLEKIPLNIDHYVLLFEAHQKANGGDSKIIELIKEMIGFNVVSEELCNSWLLGSPQKTREELIQELSKLNNGLVSEQWLDKYCRAGILPIEAYTHLAAAYFINDQFEKGQALFEHLIQHEVINTDCLAADSLDLHLNKIYSIPKYNELVDAGRIDPRHPHAANSGLVLSILHKRLMDKENAFPSTIVTGRGLGTTKKIVIDFLREHGFEWEKSHRGGALINIKKLKPLH